MKKTLLSTLLLAFFASLSAQNLLTTTFLGVRTQSQLTAQFNLPFIQYGAKVYRITYTTPDLQGLTDTVSGLLVTPDNPTKVYPRLVYQHGTAGSKLGVPSFNVFDNGEGQVGLLFAGLGYVSLLPDYLGLGVSDGFHPYVHAASEAWVALDMLRAATQFAAQNNVHTNDQLFITGYSQGGHAAMALHREIETNLSGEFTVTAAAPASGPYSIGDIMRGLILSNDVYYYPAYIPNTALSYQTAYGNIFNQVTDIFKPVYAAPILEFYNGNLDLSDLNNQLIDLLVANEGACIPTKMIQPAVITAVENDPNHPINVALRANDVYHWAPQGPTRLFYCTADDQVPFANALLARDTMLARGAADLAILDVSPSADHVGCVVPALTQTLFFFLGFQQVGTYVGTSAPVIQPITISPNPASDNFSFDNPSESAVLHVTASDGRVVLNKALPAGTQKIGVENWSNGFYLIQLYTGQGMYSAKLVVAH